MFSFGKPSKKKFAIDLRDAIASVNDAISFRYDAESFSLIGDGDESRVVNLANLYAEHCSLDKAERPANLIRVASIFSTSPTEIEEDFEDAKPHLRPKIWNRSTFEFMELKRKIEGGKALDLPLYPVGSHLYSTLVYDTENAMRSLTNEELKAWGVTYYEAMEVARQNLDESTLAFANIGENFYSSATGDSYDSSRVMLLDRLRSFDISGERIAVVPQRDAMHVASSTDETSLAIMFDMIEQSIADEPRPLSPLPMRLVDGEWVDWAPPKNHVLRPRYDDLELRYLGGLYTEQKELLEHLMQDEENAPFVASFSAVQKEGGKLTSYCVWTEGIESLLPRTQMLMFGNAEAGVKAAGLWDHVASLVGDLLVADESYYPTRYRVKEFPSDALLDEIGVMEPDEA